MNDSIQKEVRNKGKDKVHPGLHPDHGQVGVEEASPVTPYGAGLPHDLGLRKDKDGQKEAEIYRCEIHG